MWYEFRWTDANVAHIAEHDVSIAEAEHVVNHARRPFPTQRGERYFVAGPTVAGAWLQVVFVVDDGGTIYVIHARPLTADEASRFQAMIRRGRTR